MAKTHSNIMYKTTQPDCMTVATGRQYVVTAVREEVTCANCKKLLGVTPSNFVTMHRIMVVSKTQAGKPSKKLLRYFGEVLLFDTEQQAHDKMRELGATVGYYVETVRVRPLGK